MKNSKFGKILGTTVALVTALTLAAPSTSFAANGGGDTGGGTGGGGNGGGSQTSVQWASITNKNAGKAYSKFLGKTGLPKANVEREIRKRVGDLNVCKRSNVIWFIKSGGNWTFNYTGATHGKAWNGRGTIENPKTKYGSRGPTDAEIRAFKVWDKTENKTKINKKPGYTIICSGAFSMPDKKWKEVSKSSNTTSKDKKYTNPYTWTTDIKRQNIQKKAKGTINKDLIGEENLTDQKGTPVKSNFGKLWDKVKAGKYKNLKTSELKKKVDAAVKKDESKAHGTVNLNAKNKAGMAEGGVLNVYERTLPATITSTEKVTTVTTTTCNFTQKWDMKKGKYKDPTKKCKDTKAKSSKFSVSASKATQQNTGFWQMLSVHCNKIELEALLKADKSIKVVDTGDSTKGIAAVVYSKKYKQQPAELDFGDAENSNKAKAATGLLGFYDKECPFDCTPSSNSGDGASNANGATKNKGTNSENVVSGGKYGATSDGKSNNFFEFFRDNEEKAVSVDVWYPKSSGVVKYDKKAPKTTTIIRDPEGTPGVTGKDGGKFTMKTKGGTELFTKAQDAKTQKNWSEDIFSNSNATILKGLEREFLVKATWASDTNKPQVINTKWEYDADVSTKFFGKNVGFGAKSAQKTGSVVTASTPIEGKCYSNFGTKSQFDTSKLFNTNTGTGTTNGLDKNVLEKATKPQEKQTNLVFNFVRSTTE